MTAVCISAQLPDATVQWQAACVATWLEKSQAVLRWKAKRALWVSEPSVCVNVFARAHLHIHACATVCGCTDLMCQFVSWHFVYVGMHVYTHSRAYVYIHAYAFYGIDYLQKYTGHICGHIETDKIRLHVHDRGYRQNPQQIHVCTSCTFERLWPELLVKSLKCSIWAYMHDYIRFKSICDFPWIMAESI